MKYTILIPILLLISCSINSPKEGQISWLDVQGTKWSMVEDLNIFQKCKLVFYFSCDTIYLVKVYYDTETGEIESYRYMKGKIYNKRYEKDSDGDINLWFTWARKHYADPTYEIPVESFDYVDDWFLYKIDEQDHLLMGIVVYPNKCSYWTLDRE